MSKEVFKLSKPLYVNGQELNELSYTLDLEVEDILKANSNRALAHNGVDTTMKVVEFDTELHLFVGMQAIMKINPHIDITDLKRLSGSDILHLFKIGRVFFTKSASAVSTEQSKTLESTSVTIQEDTTVQS